MDPWRIKHMNMNLVGVSDVVIGQWVAANGGVVGYYDETDEADDRVQKDITRQVEENGAIIMIAWK